MEQVIKSGADLTVSLKTAAFDAEPGTKLEIVDRWQEGECKYLRVRHPESRRTARYHIMESFTLADRIYVVLHARQLDTADAVRVLAAVADENHILALTSDNLQEVMSQIETGDVESRIDQIHEFIGAIEDRTKRIKFLRSYLEDALTASVKLSGSEVLPATKLIIGRKWHHFGTIFLTLKQELQGEPHEFRLVWIVEVEEDVYAILAYPADVTADSSVAPRIIVKIMDTDSMSAIAAAELLERRETVIDMICGRNEIIPYEAARHIGAIESAGALR